MKSTLKAVLKNKYVLVSICFLVWMSFIDKHNFYYVKSLQNTVQKAEKDLVYYNKSIKNTEARLHLLTTSQAHIEKFARETYYMKKQNEDVYLIVAAE